MDLSHIFYKELPIDDNNIFSANLAENIEFEEVSLKKDQKYIVTGLSINQKTDTDVIIPDLNARNSLSDMLRSYEEEWKKSNLNCHFYKRELFDITIPFKTRTDILTARYTCFDTTTNKNETIEFYDYYDHLKNFGFKWENETVQYEITLPQKQIENFFWCKHDKNALLVNETTTML